MRPKKKFALIHRDNKYAVVVCRNTGLTDEAHIKFSANFGDLDDVKPYQQAGRPHRLAYPELFDAGNIDPQTGDVAPLTAAQVIGNKVGEYKLSLNQAE
jgi:alpha-ketoglutarate-dependent 2,4-dichlorophenoxyacetate dioxygenase